ncbi:transporter [Paenibacillus physcomitrellae]|uniref:transporter n=1 Tax=Paenibacillus physcomitrellae TaxID=1619311 RepID=UPI000B8C731C|nr:transporter [Paenibacillus physcomitrellae]
MGLFSTPGTGGGFPGSPSGSGVSGGTGFPGGFTGGFPGGFPGGVQAPSSPPPQFLPQMSATTFAIDPGAIRGCLFRNTYVWLNNGEQFWFFPIFVGRNSVAGFRWFGFFWAYFGIDLNRIRSFTCF